MERTINEMLRNPRRGEPVWGIAQLFPPQGSWTVEEYLSLDTNVFVEYVDGCLEFPPIPTDEHQRIVGILYRALFTEIDDHDMHPEWPRTLRDQYGLFFAAIDGCVLGRVYCAPYRVEIRPPYSEQTLPRKKFREPDVTCVFSQNQSTMYEQYTEAADLVVEVVSPDDPTRDLKVKRGEYAAAGIAEYWIADPRDRTLTVLALEEGRSEYREVGRYGVGETAASVLVEGLRVEVGAVFSGD